MKFTAGTREKGALAATESAPEKGALPAPESALVRLIERTLGDDTEVAWQLVLPSGRALALGTREPAFVVTVRDRAGLAALRSLDELRICEAYMDEHLGIDGDVRAAVSLRAHLNDQSVWLSLWRRLEPLLIGSTRARAKWVANHYDAENLQLYFLDREYHAYTPGHFESDADALEVASDRKLRAAYESLRLVPGARVLDVGFGWGPFVRYAGRRGVHVTGLTLSRTQLAWVQSEVVDRESLPAALELADFFQHRPKERYEAAVLCGVSEELVDHAAVMDRLAAWLVPGGRAYLDFISAQEDFVLPAFITKHVFQGRTRRVHLPRLIAAVDASPLELVELHDDRRNYRLTAERWLYTLECRREEIRARFGERLFRLFRLYLAATATMLADASRFAGASRLVLELPVDGAHATRRRAALR